MKNVPPSVRKALIARNRQDILEQEGDYVQYKAQIDQIIHGNEPLQNPDDKYDSDIQEPKMSPEEAKANKAIEGYGEKYKIADKASATKPVRNNYDSNIESDEGPDDFDEDLENKYTQNEYDDDWMSDENEEDDHLFEEASDYAYEYDYNGDETIEDVIGIVKDYSPNITQSEAEQIADSIWKSGKVNGKKVEPQQNQEDLQNIYESNINSLRTAYNRDKELGLKNEIERSELNPNLYDYALNKLKNEDFINSAKQFYSDEELNKMSEKEKDILKDFLSRFSNPKPRSK